MHHQNRAFIYLMLGIAALVLVLAFGINPAYLLVLAVCPLMMLFMMHDMGHTSNDENPAGHGCEHDPARQDHHAQPHT